jgi:hypothetical protein
MHPMTFCFFYFGIFAVNETSSSQQLLSLSVYKDCVFLSYVEAAAKKKKFFWCVKFKHTLSVTRVASIARVHVFQIQEVRGRNDKT